VKVEFKCLPLTSIRLDPDLSNDVLEITETSTYDESLVKGYIDVQHDFKFTDFIRVWENDQKYYLVENYACYKAHQSFYFGNPGKQVECIILSDATKFQIQEHTQRIKDLREAKLPPHLSRLLTLKVILLAEPNLQFSDFQRMRGVTGKVQSDKGRQLDRDYKLATSDHFFCGLMGIKNLSERPLKPKVGEAIYNYGFCANRLVKILGTNREAIEIFHEHYNQYIESVRQRRHPQDFDVKPIFEWSNLYDADEVILLAEASARKAGYLPLSRAEDRDIEWNIDRSIAHDIKIPVFNFNQRDHGLINVKRLAEFEYKSGIMHFSAKSHLGRIKPTKHGDPIRVKSRDIDPSYESPMNNFEFDSPYFEWVRHNFALSFCVRHRLLKSVGLRAEIFGFADYRPNSTTTYEFASDKFNVWYEDEFIQRMVFKSASLKAEYHPRFKVYYSIKTFLESHSLKAALTNIQITFKDFCLQVFAYVFNEIDLVEEIKKVKGRALYEVLGEATPSELEALIKVVEKMRNEHAAP
jgi:hypothetical protein